MHVASWNKTIQSLAKMVTHDLATENADARFMHRCTNVSQSFDRIPHPRLLIKAQFLIMLRGRQVQAST